MKEEERMPEELTEEEGSTLLALLLDEENDEPIEMVGEDGEKFLFQQVAVIPHNEIIYAILAPQTPIDGIEEDECLIFKYDDQADTLLIEEDDDLCSAVYEKYLALCDEEEQQEN